MLTKIIVSVCSLIIITRICTYIIKINLNVIYLRKTLEIIVWYSKKIDIKRTSLARTRKIFKMCLNNYKKKT